MIVFTELILIAASVVAVGRRLLGDDFVIFGSYPGGLPTGQPFLDGIFCAASP